MRLVMMEVSTPKSLRFTDTNRLGMMNGLQSLDTWKESFNNPDAQGLAM